MKISFQRIITKDGLELHGLLYEPNKKTDKVLIHVHAWVGNFYENRFLDLIAKEAVSSGFAFFAFNNRGAGIVTDFIKRNKSGFKYERIGGSLEKFEDCILDINAAIDFLDRKGYVSVVLEGHSTGCQKITYFKYKTDNKKIEGLIELSPADDIAVSKRILKERYSEALSVARKMVKNSKGNNSVPKWMAFYPLLSANTFISVADPESSSGRIFDYSGGLKEIKNLNCPILAILGSKDEYQDDPQGKLKILNKQAKECSVEILLNASHWFVGHEAVLAKLIGIWLKKL
jgi:pimeloyl-ACP methyl ester carboxylesterase